MDTLEKVRNETQHLFKTLQQQRDEIKVQIHLANMEVKDQWQELEEKWQDFKFKSHQLKEVSDHTRSDIKHTALKLGEELKHAYKKIKRIL